MKKALGFLLLAAVLIVLTGCEESTLSESRQDVVQTKSVGDKLVSNQPTPTDINYSLERYSLIRRAYWINGQREKAQQVTVPIADMPLGYVVLISHGTIIGSHVVEGKVVSLNSYLTPDSEYYEMPTYGEGARNRDGNRWLPDIDGAYGENDSGIFFFTPDGKYIEWNGEYLYSDQPFEVANPVVRIQRE